MAKIKLPNYTPASGNCVQVTVECVFNFEDIAEPSGFRSMAEYNFKKMQSEDTMDILDRINMLTGTDAVDNPGILTMAKQVARSIYNEAAGEPDDKFRKVIIKHAQAAEGQSRLTAMVKSAESERGVAIKISDLDSNYWLLNVQNVEQRSFFSALGPMVIRR